MCVCPLMIQYLVLAVSWRVPLGIAEIAAESIVRSTWNQCGRGFRLAMWRELALLLCLVCSIECLNVVPRRQALVSFAAAAVSPAVLVQPAAAKSKLKTDIAKADKAIEQEIASTTGLGAGSAGKGLRGVASEQFEANDTVNKNRLQNGGVARDAKGNKINVADRNRSPEELGLKPYGG